MRFDINTIWNEAAAIILWVVEFFGCILIMKNIMLRFRDKYEGVKMEDTYKLGRNRC